MNYRKLDAKLAAVLDEMEDPEEAALSVFIYMASRPDPAASTFLKKIGVKVSGQQQIVTAQVSPRAVKELSKQPWVRAVKLSRTLRPLNGK
ncbi:MAG: hypothetical protein ONB46_14115 [candidate division KSB1 bacterium]|nr:hypothetical protein [candidate division KSB1 bacterium]MDZ7366924.1 hypothetical protein [candidate division KSB1 bacterium]MDZ7406093.1 hypothetical protein [candidate division KSB1 bacterium]